MKSLRFFTPMLAALLTLTPQIAKAQGDTILAYSPGNPQTNIRGYNKTGATLFEVLVPAADFKNAIAGKWNLNSSLAVVTGQLKAGKVKIINNNGAQATEVNLPNEPINTIFAADLNRNGYSDLVLIVHAGGKARAVVYYDPGFAVGQPATINLPSQSLYYSPAIAGTTTVGILAYNPKPAKASAVSKRKAKKNKKPAKGGNGSVQLIDTAGNVVKSYNLKKPADGQIFPFSPDGQCGFAIQSGQKLKAYRHDASLFKEVTLTTENPAVIGNYSGGSNLEEILIPQTVGLKLINISSGTTSQIALTGLPNQKERLEDESRRLNEALLAAYRNGTPLDQILDMRDQLIELTKSREEVTTAANVAGRLVRLFTGGAGAIEGVCDVVDETPNDGYGGFLVKNGDFSGKIVILTPGGKDYSNADIIKFGSYKTMQKLTDSGYGNPDSNGARKHFRGNGTVQSIGKFIFRAQLKENFFSDATKKHCWYINKPAARID